MLFRSRNTNQIDKLEFFNFSMVYAHCLAFAAGYRITTLQHLNKNYSLFKLIRIYLKISIYLVEISWSRFLAVLKNISKANRINYGCVFYDVHTIREAIGKVELFTEKTKIQYNTY